MDAMSGLLGGPHARGAFLLRCVLSAPWGLRIEDEAPLTVLAMLEGSAWITPDARRGPNESGSSDDSVSTRLGPGEFAIVRGPYHYLLSDEPSSAPQVVVHPGQRCTTIDGRDLREEMTLGVRTWGNSAGGETTFLVGTYERPGEISRRLVEALPAIAVLRDPAWDNGLVEMLRLECERDEPGQDAVLDRLLDLTLITALRAWFSEPAAEAPPWYLAHGDPVVGVALKLLHNNPEHPWTLTALAQQSHVSRSVLSRRFQELVGESPIGYLTGWRLSLAADLLIDPDLTIAQVASRVGYANPFALSAAFKRIHGLSPRRYRELA